jgi:hypothetical protein
MTLQKQLEQAYQDRLEADAKLEKLHDHRSKLIEQLAQASSEIKRLKALIEREQA